MTVTTSRLVVDGAVSPSDAKLIHTGAVTAITTAPHNSGPASAESNGTAQVAIRLTTKSGSARVDDVYIDPRMR